MNKKNEGGKPSSYTTLRIIDANLNRLREGIRVVEDICRYFKNSKELSQKLKTLRHKARIKEYIELIKNRDITNDPLKETTCSEKKRDNLESIIISNIKRAQESARVLEEILKLTNSLEAEKFKNIRYELYNVEKEILL
ncbi:thiamine-phosphate pyrophosphorylase [Sulfurospirillum sp. 1307]|jgi:thiamine-phosphate pyrophosphorylase